MYNNTRISSGTVDGVGGNSSRGYMRVPMTRIDSQSNRVVIAPGNNVPISHDLANPGIEKKYLTQRGINVELAESIYSAGTLRSAYFAAVFGTFVSQAFILYLFASEDSSRFTSSIGYRGDIFHVDVFNRALGRFICFVVILLKGQKDLQNAIDLMFTTYWMGIICGILQITVALFLPVAFVYGISSSETFFKDITKTGLLRIFLELDSRVYALAVVGNKQDAAQSINTSNVVCVCEVFRYWVRTVFMPLYTFGFFFITWYAALEQYPLAFLFFFFTLGIYFTPFFD